MVARKPKDSGKKRSAKVRSLSPKSLAADKARRVKGGFEIKDYSFGAENTLTIGSGTSPTTTKK